MNIAKETFLEFLRRTGFRWNRENSRETMDLIVKNQAAFPTKIREAIILGIRSSVNNPAKFCSAIERAVYFAMTWYETSRSPELQHTWLGLDNETDTNKQVEVAFRLFPHNLGDIIKAEIDGRSYTGSILLWLSMKPKTRSFAPLVAGLAAELNIVPNFNKEKFYLCMVTYIPLTPDTKEDTQLDDVGVSVLMCLVERGFFHRGSKELGNICREVVLLRPFRSQKTFEYLLRFDPEPLLGGAGWKCLMDLSVGGEEVPIERFNALCAFGIVHYPTEMQLFTNFIVALHLGESLSSLGLLP